MPARSQAQRGFIYSHFGSEWATEHHFNNKGKLPEKVKHGAGFYISPEVQDVVNEFWERNPNLRSMAKNKYDSDPIDDFDEYWDVGLLEPEHEDVLQAALNTGVFSMDLAQKWMNEEATEAEIDKSGVPDWAHYRPSEKPGVSCSTCDFFVGGRCEMFDYTPVSRDYVCDRWEGTVEKEADLKTLAPMYTGVPERGDPPSENPQSLIDLLQALEPARELDEVARAKITGKKKFKKGTAHPAILHLRVNGMTRLPSGHMSYRMMTRDNHYVGRTNATHIKARKGDVLKVQANDFMQDANGDYIWQNPNVVSHYSDTAHSLKELEALAGGSLVKDAGAAPGPAGDLPTPGDPVGTSKMPSGPTLASVHVDVPLSNVSLFYGNKKLKYKVQKANQYKQLIYGVVLEPDVIDSQNDYMLPTQVERAAHTYMKKGLRGKASVSKLQHRRAGFFKNKPSVVPVESFIAPVDFSYDGKEMVKKGTWVMVLHVEDPSVWDDVLKGEFTGLSIGGVGVRQSVSEGLENYHQVSDWFKGVSS